MADEVEVTELQEQLAEARAEIESLQAATANAEARAATALAELSSLKEDADTARQISAAELAEIQARAEALGDQLRQAALRYREARLASAPQVPAELVPELGTIEEIDREFESAQRVVAQLQERLQAQALEERRSARIPAGSPRRATPDGSALSASDKIRLGLQQLSERERR